VKASQTKKYMYGCFRTRLTVRWYKMDQTKALVKLIESADLIRMLEDLTNPNLTGQLSPAALSGVRVTLRNVRESIVNCHESFTGNGRVDHQHATSHQQRQSPRHHPIDDEIGMEADYDIASDSVEFMTKSGQHEQQVRRGDLRVSLAKMVERA
jgi:hypothetical protein